MTLPERAPGRLASRGSDARAQKVLGASRLEQETPSTLHRRGSRTATPSAPGRHRGPHRAGCCCRRCSTASTSCEREHDREPRASGKRAAPPTVGAGRRASQREEEEKAGMVGAPEASRVCLEIGPTDARARRESGRSFHVRSRFTFPVAIDRTADCAIASGDWRRRSIGPRCQTTIKWVTSPRSDLSIYWPFSFFL